MIVNEIMSQNPYAVSATTSIRHVLEMLAEADVRHLPILEEGALVGIISDRDLRGFSTLAEFSGNSEDARRALAESVSTVMSSDVVTVQPDSEVSEAIDLMIEHRIGAIPVVEADGAKLVGIVSYVDALRAARNFL